MRADFREFGPEPIKAMPSKVILDFVFAGGGIYEKELVNFSEKFDNFHYMGA